MEHIEDTSNIEELDSLFNDHFGLTDRQSVIPPDSEGNTVDSDSEGNPEVDTCRLVTDYIEQVQDSIIEDPFLESCEIAFKDCGCENKCVESFHSNDVVSNILTVREMSKSEKEQLIMSILSTVKIDGEKTCRGPRKRVTHRYSFAGRKICRDAFMSIYDINDFTLRALSSHVQDHGVSPRKHGNTGRKPAHALTYEDVLRVVNFLQSYADDQGLPQPAAPRGRDGIAPIYLHSSNTKRAIHSIYESSLQEQNVRRVKLSAFCQIWQSCLPHIIIASPRHDVCATCEQCRKNIVDAVTEEAKLQLTTRFQNHVLHAQAEREFYNDCIRQSKTALENVGAMESPRLMHYTFDFAQNVSLPHHSRQMGPLYFLTLKKVQVFGFRSDGEPRQLLYLFDEGQSIGIDGKNAHGPDAVISMVHHGLESLGKGERTCVLHADNCAGQNKNRYVMAYLIWRVMTGLHDEIQLHMQIPGHSRCLVDAGFANFKRVFKRCDANCLEDLQDQVNKSSSVNQAVLYPAWRWYRWKELLNQHFKAMRGISSYQHFRISRDRPGEVLARKKTDDEDVSFQLLRNPDTIFDIDRLPEVAHAGGLSHERQRYLYRNVRPYVRSSVQEITCPRVVNEE